MTSPYGQPPQDPQYPPQQYPPPQYPQQQYPQYPQPQYPPQQPPPYPPQQAYPPQPAYEAPPAYQPPGYQPGPTPPPPPVRAWWQRKRVLIPAGVIALFVIVGMVNGAGDSTVTPASTSDAVDAAAVPAAGEAPADDGVATFGERLTLPSGLAFEVVAPSEYQPGQYAAGHDRERAVIVEITVINGTSAPYEFNPFIVGPTATHDSRPAPEIIDFQSEEVGVTAVSTILPGSSLTYRVALSIGANPADLQLELKENIFDSPALFVGQV